MLKYHLVIEAGRSKSQYWRDLWQFRELFYFLAWRDVLVRYQQPVIGASWALIKPLLTMVVFTIVFGKIAKLPSGGAPYPIMVFVAMLPWQFFSTSFAEAGNSLVVNAPMISKVYFPRLILPTSTVIVSLIDFLISFAIMLALMVWYRFVPDIKILLLPLFFLLVFMASIAGGLWIAALNVRYRDFRYIIPFVVQFGLYISPVGFSSAVIPEKWRLLYSLNPMVGVIDGFRWAVLGGEYQLYWPGFLLSILLVVVILFSGIAYFRKTEKTFADVI